jgi:asparagine synthase (glutamine-hydrolysing)
LSAIIGAWRKDGRPVELEALRRMATALSHRGTSCAWEGVAPEACLGMIRDRAERGVQPALTRRAVGASALVLTAAVRLDNRDAVRRALGDEAGPLETDAELILGAYERWGERCPEHLLGDFAFVVRDGRDGSLFCARDHIGARAFYYHDSDEHFVFGSEIKAVLAYGGIDATPDDEKIADYLGQIFADRERTFYKGVRRLAPGHTLRVAGDRVTPRRYWSLDRDLRCELPSDDAYAARFRELFEQAVRCRVPDDTRWGVLLSGGLDSSSLVGLLRARRESWGYGAFPVLSARFPEFPAIDEGRHIDLVTSGGHVEPHSLSASDTSPLHEIEAVLAHSDEPFNSPNLFIYWALAARAQSLGVRVLLDGVDGDTTVGHGLEWVGELLRAGRLTRAVAESRALARRFGRPAWQFFWHFGVRKGLVAPLAHALASGFGRGNPRPPATMSPELVRRVDWDARIRAVLGDQLAPPRTLREVHWRALTSDLVPHFLELDERASAAFGIDSRHPYFDQRLIEFCYSTPPDQKLSDGWDRVVQRRAIAGLVPESIQWRVHKSRWDDQFKTGLLVSDRVRIADAVASPGAASEYLDTDQLEAAWGRCARGSASDQDIMSLWLGVTLVFWLRTRFP